MALIWFSCLPCASENFRVMPASFADCWIDLVFAVRQPLSAPTWAKPIVILPPPPPPVLLPPELLQAVRASVAIKTAPPAAPILFRPNVFTVHPLQDCGRCRLRDPLSLGRSVSANILGVKSFRGRDLTEM